MDYFVKTIGNDWEEVEGFTLPHIPAFTQNDLEVGVGNCSLASIVRVLSYYRAAGHPFPDEKTLYAAVKKIAVSRRYKEHGRGTPFYRIGKIMTAALKEYGVSGKGKSRYVWSFADAKKELDARRPFLFNIALGHYRGHTVTAVGYKILQSGAERKTLLSVYDGWSREMRYIDMAHIHIGSFTAVRLLKGDRV